MFNYFRNKRKRAEEKARIERELIDDIKNFTYTSSIDKSDINYKELTLSDIKFYKDEIEYVIQNYNTKDTIKTKELVNALNRLLVASIEGYSKVTKFDSHCFYEDYSLNFLDRMGFKSSAEYRDFLISIYFYSPLFVEIAVDNNAFYIFMCARKEMRNSLKRNGIEDIKNNI